MGRRRPREEPLSEGAWNQNISWQIYVNREMPPLPLCTAVSCFTFSRNGLFMVQNFRGWGPVMGSIEEGETPEIAALREIKEETGSGVRGLTYFGYKICRAEVVTPNPDKSRQLFPFPRFYIPFFYGFSEDATTGSIQPDIFTTGIFPLYEAYTLLAQQREYPCVLEYLEQVVPILR